MWEEQMRFGHVGKLLRPAMPGSANLRDVGAAEWADSGERSTDVEAEVLRDSRRTLRAGAHRNRHAELFRVAGGGAHGWRRPRVAAPTGGGVAEQFHMPRAIQHNKTETP